MNLFPTGTITYLFTDIAGSTKLWEQHPEAMGLALARHDALLRDFIHAAGGVVFKTMGDGFYAAFTAASDALTAVLQAQRALRQEDWPQETPIHVRMALHTGVAEVRDGDYFGTVLNRTARLLTIGHGGQVLVSAATYELVRDRSLAGIGFISMGLHRLKDLERPEQIFQMVHTDLPDSFPPLRSPDNAPNNLPQQLTSFIGREKEMAQLHAHLGRTRLLTLTGSAGTGKTRLALQAAADVREAYPDGIWLIELAPLIDAALVVRTVASALGIKEDADQSLQQTLMERLKTQKMLLLLDNCEHLLAICAQFAAVLLRSCPDLHLLITSREPLGIAGEVTYRIPSLSLPDPKARFATAESLSQYEAVRLFIERAQSVKPNFAVTDANALVLSHLCHQLDGIPLALELAAARVRSLSVEDINDRLSNRFRLLTGGDRSALPRQQTLQALVDWSYDLLNEQEKVLLRRLSIFTGGWALTTAEAVCGFDPIDDWQTLDLLTGLVDKSLVLAEQESETVRYRLLETLRQYASEKCDRDESERLRQRHCNWFVALAEEAEPELTGSNQVAWLTKLEAEHDNLRTALAWCWDNAGEDDPDRRESGVRLSGALDRFWWVRGYLGERWGNLQKAVEKAGAPTVARAKVLAAAGGMAYSQGNAAGAQSLYGESLAVYRDLGNSEGVADLLNDLGNIACRQGHFDEARSLLEESLALRKARGDQRGIALSLESQGLLAYRQGNHQSARTSYEESLTAKRQLGDKQGIAMSLHQIGNVINAQGDGKTARARYEEGLVIFRELGDLYGIANTLISLGMVDYSGSDRVMAWSRYHESFTIREELEDVQGIALALGELAELAFSRSEVQSATVLWGATRVLRESFGISLSAGPQEGEDTLLTQACSILGEATYATFWNEGRGLTWGQAIKYALVELPARRPRS